MNPPPRLWLVGASVRAAASSALRAGFPVAGADFFRDRDLPPVGPFLRIDPELPRDRRDELVLDAAREAPPGPWLYVGAFENRPDLVDRVAARKTLLGLPGDVLRPVRDPLNLARVLREAGLPVPETLPADPGTLRRVLERDHPREWLVKPIRSGGGHRVRTLEQAIRDARPPVPGSDIVQRRVPGIPASAVFVAGDPGTDAGPRVELLGVTRQILGAPGAPFAYAGSIGPWEPDLDPDAPPVEPALRLGTFLAREFRLRGLFGVDFILDDDRNPQCVEVNPRYTASVEILEWTRGRAAVAEHAAAFGFPPPSNPSPAPRPHPVAAPRGAKILLHATRPCRIDYDPEDVPELVRFDPARPPAVADIPDPGTVFRPGQPVLTLLAFDEDPRRLPPALERAVRTWTARLAPLDDS